MGIPSRKYAQYLHSSIRDLRFGFYSLYENNLAAIFVHPEFQGKGIGKQLMSHAKKQRVRLTLSVYIENEASYQFYLSQGFAVISGQTDEHTGHQEYTMSIGT